VRLLEHEASSGSPHPQATSAVLIPRLGVGQARLVPLFFERGFRTVALPLYYGQMLSQLTLGARTEASGLVLDPMTHIRQQPREERAKSFRALPYGDETEAFDPDRDELNDASIENLALEPPELQRLAGATLILTTYAVAGGIGTRGRDLELLLARLAVEDFQSQRFDEPPDGAPYSFRRQVYATIAAPVDLLRSPTAARKLAEAYLDISADGFWVKLLGFDERAHLESIEAAGRFFSYLREGQRPLVACCPGQLFLGFLVDDISASIGIAGHERFSFPRSWRPGSEGKGRSRPIYSGRLMRSLMSHDRRLTKVFERAPCRCRSHDPHIPPSAGAIDFHAASCRAEQAIDALDGDRLDRREWLSAIAERATEVAEDLDLPKKPINPPYRRLLEGLDGGAGARAGLSDVG
jgi:hypothetical protein